MSYNAIRAVLEGHIKTLATDLGVKVKYENVPFSEAPGDDELYLATSLLIAEPAPASVGLDGVDRARGILQVSIMQPRGDGTAAALAMVDQIKDHFSRGLKLAGSGTEVTIVRAWPSAALLVGNYSVTPVSVSWFSYL